MDTTTIGQMPVTLIKVGDLGEKKEIEKSRKLVKKGTNPRGRTVYYGFCMITNVIVDLLCINNTLYKVGGIYNVTPHEDEEIC